METKEDLIKASIRQLLRIANKYARIEKLPIYVDGDTAITTGEAHTIQAIGEQELMTVTDVANHFGRDQERLFTNCGKTYKKGVS